MNEVISLCSKIDHIYNEDSVQDIVMLKFNSETLQWFNNNIGPRYDGVLYNYDFYGLTRVDLGHIGYICFKKI